MNVLVIAEDFRKDRYILEPVVQAMLAAVDKPRAKVTVMTDPLLGGIDQALDWQRLEPALRRYQYFVNLFLLCVDRDGNAGRHQSLADLEARAQAMLPADKAFFAVHAWQEVEVWALAGIDYPDDWVWNEVRDERDAKEQYFEPLARDRKLLDEPGEGRRTLGREAARRYDRIRQLCPEVEELEQRIRAWIDQPG